MPENTHHDHSSTINQPTNHAANLLPLALPLRFMRTISASFPSIVPSSSPQRSSLEQKERLLVFEEMDEADDEDIMSFSHVANVAFLTEVVIWLPCPASCCCDWTVLTSGDVDDDSGDEVSNS